MKFNFIAVLSTSFLILILVSSLFLNFRTIEPVRRQLSSKKEIVGYDRDEQGCIVSAGYSWCKEKQKCLRIWEEPCTKEEQENKTQITEALMEKYGWVNSDIEVFIQNNDGNYAYGTFMEIGKSSNIRFFAAKIDNEWEIVWDEKSTDDCKDLDEKLSFPINLFPECYDSASDTLIIR